MYLQATNGRDGAIKNPIDISTVEGEGEGDGGGEREEKGEKGEGDGDENGSRSAVGRHYC